MDKIKRGDVAPIQVEFRYLGALVDMPTVIVSIEDPLGETVIDEAIMIKKSTGKYTYRYIVSTSAMPGIYQAHGVGRVGFYDYGEFLYFRVIE